MGLAEVIAIIQQIPSIVGLVESLIPGRGKGEFKKGFVTKIVLLAVKGIEGLKHEDLVNDQAFAEGVSEVIEGAVKAINAVNKHA